MKKYQVTLTIVPNEEDDPPRKWDWYELLGCDVTLEEVKEIPLDA